MSPGSISGRPPTESGSLPDSRNELVHRFFSGTGPSYDWVVNLNTFGFDLCWKRRILKKIPTEATRILDQGCGTGILTFRIARKFPLARVVGVELRDEYLQIAREKARQANFSNVAFILGRAEDVLPGGLFDCITSSYLAKYAELKVLIRNAKKMLRSGGGLIMHDFIYPRNPVVARIWEYYFRLLQTVGNRRYPQWREIYCGLPLLIRETKWMGELTHILKENDFSDISLQPLTLHTSAIITARRS